jgi:hypothetical protein
MSFGSSEGVPIHPAGGLVHHAEGTSDFDGGHPSLLGLDGLLAQVFEKGVHVTIVHPAQRYYKML